MSNVVLLLFSVVHTASYSHCILFFFIISWFFQSPGPDPSVSFTAARSFTRAQTETQEFTRESVFTQH